MAETSIYRMLGGNRNHIPGNVIQFFFICNSDLTCSPYRNCLNILGTHDCSDTPSARAPAQVHNSRKQRTIFSCRADTRDLDFFIP